MPTKSDNVYQGDGPRWLTDAEICAKLRISQSTRERRVKAKILPEATRLGPRCKRTREDLIDEAIEALANNPPPPDGWGNPPVKPPVRRRAFGAGHARGAQQEVQEEHAP